MKSTSSSCITVVCLTVLGLACGVEHAQKSNNLPPSGMNDQMCEIASLELLSYSRCDLMTRVRNLELLVQTFVEQLAMEQPVIPPSGPVVAAEVSSPEKRKNEFIRFGKRKNEFIRFGKRKNEFIRFGRSSMDAQNVESDQSKAQESSMEKRKNEFIRFG